MRMRTDSASGGDGGARKTEGSQVGGSSGGPEVVVAVEMAKSCETR